MSNDDDVYAAASWIAFHGASDNDRQAAIIGTAPDMFHNPAIIAHLNEIAAIGDVAQLHANTTTHAPNVAEVIERAGKRIAAQLPPPALQSILRDLFTAEAMK